MSQAQRRNGSRDDLRYARERARPASYQQNKPYKTRVPAEDTTPTASILKTRAFKLLVTAVGIENIALALDSNLARVTELENGKGFTAETAFHMETTLGLPDGFFDQPDPVLAPEIIARLKSPLELWRVRADVAEINEDVGVAVSEQTVAHGSPEDELLAEEDMPRNKRSAAAQNTARGGTASEQKVANVGKAPLAESKGSRKPDATQSPALNDLKALAETRRVNLHTLTRHQGAKAQLGRLLEISQSNMAHRFYGRKRMDDVEAQRVTDKLGLPAGWLDVPREPADVPEAVADLLSSPSGRLSVQSQPDLHLDARSSGRASTQDTSAVKSGSDKPASPIAGHNLALSEIAFAEPASGLPSEQTSDNAPSMMLTLPDEVAQSAPSATSCLPEAYPSMSATSLETLHGIAPIAEALLKTLAGKARTGHLDETRALHLLQQVVLL